MDKSQLKEKPIKERKFQGNSVIRDTSGKIIPGKTSAIHAIWYENE